MRSIDEIRRIKAEVEREYLRIPGIVGMDIGNKYINGKKTNIIAIRFMVKEKKNVPEKDSIPKEIQGIPTDVIQRSFKLHRYKGD